WSDLAPGRSAARAARGEGGGVTRGPALSRRRYARLLRSAVLHGRRGEEIEAEQRWSNVVRLASAMSERPPAVDELLARGRAFLERHNGGIADAVERELGASLAAMGPEARRFQACVDHSLGRRRIYQNDCAGLYYPFLPAYEFFDRSHFPWFAEIEARTEAIRDEALALLAGGNEAIRPYVRQDAGTPQNKWSALDHSLDWSACFLWEYGEKNESICALCPETAAALDAIPQNRIPGKAPSAFFSILKPGAHIPPHTGVTNTRAIVHLPLVVPPDCSFRVGGETREWKVGEAFAFDDTIEHEAWNRSAERRIVLILDVWNPHLSAAEQDMLARFFDITSRAN
ncbi:MAG: aspartyl/asparaginyl beta-hydroxylase domain-containing protein, partial [Sphingopyxis sp.]|nr:aspartyl/asparaginyl beta-hydroxylase domain-containing protein [Sphingopyxis sp.]